MEKQRNAVRTGIFMVVSLLLIIFVILAVSGAARFTESFKTYQVQFALKDDVGGLRSGDEVRIGGVKQGSVRDIVVKAPGQGRQPFVLVYVDLPSKFTVAKNAHVAIEKGITGAASINIDDLGSGTQIAQGEYLTGQPDSLSQTLDNIRLASGKLNSDLDRAGTMVDAFTSTGFAATATVQSLEVRLPEVIEGYDEVVRAATRALQTIHEFLGPSSTDFHGTMLNLHNVSGDLSHRLPGMLDEVHVILARIDSATDRANHAMGDIEAAGSNIRDISAGVRSIIVDNQSKLDAIVASLKATTDNLKYASIEIRHSPWRLLYQPKPGEMANLNTYDSIRQFAESANNLDDAADALRDLIHDPNADPQDVRRLMAHLNDTFGKFQAVQAKLWSDIRP